MIFLIVDRKDYNDLKQAIIITKYKSLNDCLNWEIRLRTHKVGLKILQSNTSNIRERKYKKIFNKKQIKWLKIWMK